MNIDPRQVRNSPDADLGYLMRYYQERGCKGSARCAPVSPMTTR